MTNYKLYIAHGLPGGGKSYLSRELAKKHDGLIVSADNFFTFKPVWNDAHGGFYYWHPEHVKFAHEYCRRQVALLMINKYKTIIVDNTNLTILEIEPYLDMALTHRYDVEIVAPQTEWANNIEECFKRNTHRVPLDTLHKMAKRKMPLEKLRYLTESYMLVNESENHF